MQSNRYWDKWKDELDEQDIYESIKRSLMEEDEDYYARGGGSSSSNRGGSSSSSYHSNPTEKLRQLSRVYEKIGDFFLAMGEDIKSYTSPIEGRRR